MCKAIRRPINPQRQQNHNKKANSRRCYYAITSQKWESSENSREKQYLRRKVYHQDRVTIGSVSFQNWRKEYTMRRRQEKLSRGIHQSEYHF